MATHDYIISNASGAAVRADLNNALAAIATNNSSATAPTTTYAYQWWADTGSSPTVMKLRNAANSAWITLFQLDGEWSLIPFENGTAAAPSIYFKDSGTDTGIFSPGTDQVGISAGGTSRFEVSTTATTSTLPVVLPLGAVGTPSITFTGDLNTGIYSPAADTIAFVEGGAEAMRIDSSSRVGIGVTPSERLHVSGNLYVAGGDIYIDTAKMITTSNTNPLRFGVGSSEKAQIDGSGRLLVGTSTTSSVSNTVLQGRSNSTTGGALLTIARGSNNPANNEELGLVYFTDSGHTAAAIIEARRDGGTWTSGSSQPTRLAFSTTADGASSPTERMRITNLGEILMQANSADAWGLRVTHAGNNSNRYGVGIYCGTNAATGTNYAVGIYDADGDNQGFITFSGGTVTYGAFTAHHPCVLPEQDNEDGYPYGTLLETVAIEYTEKDGVATERGIRYKVRKTQVANSKAVLGAYGSSMNGGPGGETNLHQALVLGDGHILCNGSGGNIKVGDGICSSAVAGIGQKATATPSMIIGIAQEDVTFDGDETKLVPVQYGLQQFIPWQE